MVNNIINDETNDINKLFNLKDFHKSISAEFESKKDRVRNLIGKSNWGEEGKYKERILKNVIKNILPFPYKIGTGFIVKNKNGNLDSSSQIDILIFNSFSPPLFSDEDFYIVSPDQVKAVISVKTNIENQDLKTEIETLEKIGKFVNKKDLFLGLFSFEGYNTFNNSKQSKMKEIFENKKFINHLCLNKNIFIKSFSNRFSFYNINDLSFSFFISNLMDILTSSNLDDNLWFSQNKEINKIFDVEKTFL